MEQYRITQILQELINDKNNELSQLNGYLSEAQTSSWNYVNPQDYQNISNEKDMAWNRVNELQNQLMSVQQNYDILVSNSSNSSAELDAMRSVLEAVRSERDFFQSQLQTKESYITELCSTIEGKNVELMSTQGSINELNNTISTQNNSITELNNQLNLKQEHITNIETMLKEYEDRFRTLKSKIRAEMEEASNEIEEVLQSDI